VEQPVATRLAAAETGIPERTLRNWIKGGKLAATQGDRGYLVRVSDVRRVAAIAGRDPAILKGGKRDAGGKAADVAASESSAIVPAGEIERAMVPIVERLEALAAELGRERGLREAAEAERDRLRDELEAERTRARRPWWRRLGGIREKPVIL
jgi:hypothetical protein